MSACFLCPRNCGADRENGILGFCGVGSGFKVAKTMLHKWEEPCISGNVGAGTIFFSGCNLRCVYCQNCDISHGSIGKEISDTELEREIFHLLDSGAECIEFVTPTHYTSRLAHLLERIKPKINVPIVWNSGGYESVEGLRLLEGLVDVYLPDFKYYSCELSQKYSAASNYREIALLAVKEMVRQVGKPEYSSSNSPLDKNILQKGVIVRHLVLPSHRQDSIDVLRLLSSEIGSDSMLLSLMSQYTPDFYENLAKSGEVPHIYSPLYRKLTTFEYNSVTQEAIKLGFNGFFQSKGSASSDYTPNFR
ncbi:MAG: 4Fe-4S cluster-binding domain-containing protein [Ruminococcaceae bacterium]|nr:4Fe-4S cluster-binding domain-containing protein [Oscillospiraceae bacterium]